MPDGKTPITNFNPNEFKVVDNSKKTVTDFNPNEFKIVGKAPNQLREGDPNTILPTYTKPIDRQVDSAIDFIKQKGGRNGSTIMDSELDVLKDVLKDTRATEDQRKRAIATIQGYDSKHDDNNTMYYNKLEDNGVYVPTALAYGEKPPKGYKVASVWGNQNQSNNDNDSWYTDLGKSLANGVLEAAQGVVDLAQVGTTLVTGEESSYLNKLSNTAEALKFKKDKDLDTPILNTEGVEKWSDLLDKDRFDLSPKALWGAFNMAAESLVGFAGGAKGATTITLGENATKATIFAGSFANQVGSVYESAKDAGLKGRDAAGFATAVAAPMAALDAFWGLDGKVMSELFYNQKKNLLKNVVKEVEKDAAGNITENGFKQLTKEMTIGYSDLVKKGVKEVVKDAVSEGGQEAAQDFTQKAGEQLWDKLTPDERGQFGTDAFNAKSFGDYINSFSTSLIPGGGMSIGTQLLRTKHDEQSINAYERVKQGPEAVTALKTDLGQALKNNDINQSEYDQAIFKIDSYDKYHQETKGVNLKPEDEKKAFELSFQIQGLKTEIPTNENEISKLDPIPRSKVESKQKQVKELQTELNDIIRQGEIKGEPVVPKKEEERVQKEKEKAQKETEKESKVETKPSAPKKEVIEKNVIVQPKLPKQPHWKEDTRSYEDIDNETFNNQGFDARTKFRTIVEKLDKEPSKESNALLIKRPYKYWDGEKWKVGDVIEAEFSDGKRIRMASSKKLEAGYRGWFREERTLGNEEGLPVGVKVIDLNNPRGEKVGEDYVPGRKILKIYDKRTGKFLSWAKETKLGKVEALDKNDQVLTTKEQGDFIKSLEQQEYNEPIAGEGEIAEIIKPKPKPTPTERAAEATQKIVEEAKTKVKEQKASVPLTITKAVRQQLYDLGFTKANVDNMKPERALDIINKQEVNKRGTSQSNKNNPVNGVEAVVFSNPNLSIEGFNIDGNSWNVVTSTDRAKTLVNINGTIVPFYLTTGQAGKGLVPGWYPFFGIGKDGWLNKTDKSDMETYYERYWGNEAASVIKSISEELNSFYGTDPSVFKNDGYPNAKSRPLTTLADKVEDYINSKLSYTPAINDANARKTLRENVEKLGKEIINANKQEINKKENGKQESAVDGEKTTNRSNEETIGKDKSTSQETKLRTSKSRIQRKVKNPFREKAAKITVDTPYDLVMQHFIGGGYIDRDSLKSFFKGKESEAFARQNLTLKLDKYNPRYAPNMKDLAHSLWEDNQEQYPKFTTEDYFNALEEVLLQNTSPIEMAKDLINKTETPTINRQEELLAGIYEEEVINSDVVDNIIDALENKSDEELTKLADKDKWEEGTDIVINNKIKTFYTENEIEKHERTIQLKLDDYFDEAEKKYGSFKKANEEINKSAKSIFYDAAEPTNTHKEYWDLIEERDKLQKHNEKVLYDIVDNSLSENKNISEELKKTLIEHYFKIHKTQSMVHAFGSANLNGNNSISKLLSNESLPKLAENIARERAEEMNLDFDALYSTISGWSKEKQRDFLEENAKIAKEIQSDIINKISSSYSNNNFEPFQKVSQRKGDITKVVEVISKAFNNKNIKVVEDSSKFTGEQSTVAGKVSADGKFIYINPNYAGFDTPIHEGGHILIDAMGYNNKIIQAAIKQLRGTDLYKETKKNYKELSDEELDKEVLAEAIGREGADIFDNVADRSKFKAYLDYIFDWLKQKLGMDKNIAKSLAKQIIGGVKTKNIEGKAGKEQLQKESKKNPLGARPLKFEQYAAEHGFSYEKETDKIEEASYLLKEAQDEYDIAKENAEVANTDEEAEPLEKILAEKEVALKAAKKNFAIKGKRTFEYKKYRKDFNEIKKLMAEKDIDNYTTEELQDLISKLHSFDNKAAKAVRTEAMLKFAMIATKKQQQVFEGKTGYIAELGKTKDITPLQRRILHHSHFSENNADMQAVSLAFGNAIMDKITDANTKKATHKKLGQKVIAEENKKLGIIGAQTNRFSSDSAKYFEWMSDKDGNLMTIDEAKAKGLSEAKINYLKFTRETIADYRGQLEENNFENAVMQAIRIDKGFMEAYKSEGLLPAFSYYLGGGANNLGKVRIEHNGQIKSYSEIEKEILATANRKSITSMAKALFDLLVANIKARYQLKKGFNVDEKENPLELKGEAEYSLNEKGQLVSKFDKPRAKDRGYSKDFYKAMNQFIDESAHTKHISKIMPLVDSVEYLNKNGYMDEGYVIKPNVAKWIEDWKKLHIFKEQHVNDPVLDASIKAMRNLVASTTMWFNIPANVLNVFMGNYSNWRQENGKVVALGNKRLFGGNAKNRAYGLDLIKKYNLVNQDYDSNATMKAGSILSKIATWGTKVGEYQIQGSLGLGLLTEDEFNSFEYTKDKYGNEVLTVKEGVDEAKIKAKMIQIKNRVTDIQGKYPDEDRRNIMKGEIGKAAFQFKVWMPDWFKERFGAKYINAYGQEKEGTFRQLMRTGIKEMYADLKKGDFKNIYKNNPSFMSNLKGLATIGTLIALSHMDDDDEEVKKGSLTFQNALSQVLFILDLEQDKYMVSNPVAALGKTKDLISAFEALVTLDEKAIDKVKRVIPGNKITKAYELGKKVID